MNKLEYKGYIAEVEYSVEDQALIGTIIGLNDTLAFDCESVTEIEKSFHDLVDDYLDMCKRVGKEPEKTYKGSFNVRVSPEIHKQAAKKAKLEGKTLNEFVSESIQKNINGYMPAENQFSFVLQQYQSIINTLRSSSANNIERFIPYKGETQLKGNRRVGMWRA